MARYRVVLRSTETKPSQSTQESVLPAMSQKFGQSVEIEPADLTPDDEHQAATIGRVDTTELSVLADVYDYVKPHNLVKVGDIQASDSGTVLRRKAHDLDEDALLDREDVMVVDEVRGDLLVRIQGEEDDADGESIGGGTGAPTSGGAAATDDSPGRGYWRSDDDSEEESEEDGWV